MPRRNPRRIDPQVLAEIGRITPQVQQGMLRYVTRRARMVADAGYPVASDEPSILLADAIADTLTGIVTWDRRYDLSYHLCSVVRTRTSNQIKRAKRQTHVSLEATGNDGDERTVLEAVDPSRPDVLLEVSQVVRKLCRIVRSHAAGDVCLSALLDAYASGMSKPRDVMKLIGLTRPEYLNARRRLDRMLLRVSPDLRHAALDTMRGACHNFSSDDRGVWARGR